MTPERPDLPWLEPEKLLDISSASAFSGSIALLRLAMVMKEVGKEQETRIRNLFRFSAGTNSVQKRPRRRRKDGFGYRSRKR
jgi:hypothetical protein